MSVPELGPMHRWFAAAVAVFMSVLVCCQPVQPTRVRADGSMALQRGAEDADWLESAMQRDAARFREAVGRMAQITPSSAEVTKLAVGPWHLDRGSQVVAKVAAASLWTTVGGPILGGLGWASVDLLGEVVDPGQERLAREALLVGLAPAQLHCEQIIRQAEMLGKAAEIAFHLSRELETLEAQRALADHLWLDSHLYSAMTTDSRAYEAARRWSIRWGEKAHRGRPRGERASEQHEIQLAYRREVEAVLREQKWPWDVRPDLIPKFDARIVAPRPQRDAEWERRVAGQRMRTQVAAIVLETLAEERIRSAKAWQHLMAGISREHVLEFEHSFKGFNLPRAVYEYYSLDQKAFIDERVRRYLTDPAGVPKAQAQLVESLGSLGKRIVARVIVEADEDARLRASDGAARVVIDFDTSAFEEGLLTSLKVSATLAAAELAITAGEVAVMLGLLAAPELVVTKVSAVLVALMLVAEFAWDEIDEAPTHRRATMLRLAVTEALSEAVFGKPAHDRIELPCGTVISPASSSARGAVLGAELVLWKWLREQTQGW